MTTTIAPPARTGRSGRSVGRTRSAAISALAVLSLVAIGLGVLHLRGWSPGSTSASSDPAPMSPGMPTSDTMEARYGVRFTGVSLTGGTGILQLRYRVLDGLKAAALHAADTEPYLVLPDGATLDQPGIAGHGHSKDTPEQGRAGYVLLANSATKAATGMRVSIRVGDERLDGVPVG